MKPVLFVIPIPGWPVPIRAYGFMVMLGCLAAIFIALRRAKRESADAQAVEKNRNIIWDLWMWSLVGGFAGGRMLYIALYWDQFRDNLWNIPKIWEGGLAFQGGLAGAVLAVYIYMKVRKLPVAKYLDMVAAGVILGYAFARVGCFLNGCCHGRPTAVAWSVTYPAAAPIDGAGNLRLSPAWEAQTSGVPWLIPPAVAALADCRGRVTSDGLLRKTFDKKAYDEAKLLGKPYAMPRTCPIHPTQLYAVGYALIIFVVLLIYARMPHHLGQEVSLFGALYAVARFVIEFYRGDALPDFAGLTIFQLACIGIFIAFASAWIWCQKHMPAYVPPAKGASAPAKPSSASQG